MKIRIRTKLAAALALPLLALVGVAGYEATEAVEDADLVRAETELATVSIGPASLTSELQNERNYTALDLIGLAEAATLEVSSVEEARQRVDTAVDDLRSFLEGRDPIVQDAFEPAFATLEENLEATRELWDDYEGEKGLGNQELADEVFNRFTDMTQAFFGATETVATAVDDSTLRNGIEIVDQSNRRGELLAGVARNIVLDTLTEGNEAAFRADTAVAVDRIRNHERRVEQLSVGPYELVDDETIGRDFDVESDAYFSDYLRGESVDIGAMLAAVSAGSAEGVTSTAEMASQILADQASQLTSEADERRQQFMLLAGAVIALAVIASWLASRSITRPLRKLRDEAEEMASRRLPDAVQQILDTPLGEDVTVPHLEPIVVKTRDEVREVVEVLNDVQDRTLELAADQAVLRRNIADSFVNLGRRNQNLLDRQLEFITELEQSETDPEELESLFRLDHLATRMRRNAESLLVLAGVESPRQWSAPVGIDDVLRAALGEVEGYQRVNLRNLEPAMIAGTAASSVSHVIAELVENALTFSPPDEMVEVRGRANADGYTVAIDDFGIGMGEEELAQANRRLSGEESYTVAPSRYLGHYVAGHLATRYGISVRVQDSPAGGVTATITVPSSLLARADAPEAEDWPAPAADAPRADDWDVPAEDWPDADTELDTVPAQGRHDDVPPFDAPGPVVEPEPVAPGAFTVVEDDPAVGQDDEVPDDVPAPATLSEALGRDELAQIESVDDFNRATEGGLPRRVPGAQAPGTVPAPLRPPTEDPGTTTGGLPQRVPGAQRPELQPTIARREPVASPATSATSAPAGGDAFGFLAAFSKAADGLAASTPDNDDADPSEDR